nr:transcription antitermination protein NusB [Phocaeicola abscessus]
MCIRDRINRVLIRIKIVQIIYAYYQNGGKNLETAEKELFFSISKAFDLYNYLLLLMIELTNYAGNKISKAKRKLVPTAADLNPNTKFIDNRFIAQLEKNEQLMNFKENQKRTWDNEPDFVKNLCEKIMDSEVFNSYMASETSSYAEDRELWRKIYKTMIMNNEELDGLLEDQSLYWNGDKDIVDTFVLKTIKFFDEKNADKQQLLPEFKDAEDKDFASSLFRRSILNGDYYRHLISEGTRNWELKRIALFDTLIMQVALAEILTFPNIPVNVSLNEYVDIAKAYSTPKSGGFINGTLDGIVKQLRAQRKLLKQ